VGMALLFAVWALLSSLQFFALGDGSYIRVYDNADSNYPNRYAAEHNPELSVDHRWNHFAVCGYPWYYRGGLYGFLQRILPEWSGYALLMVLQRFVAGYFMYLLARTVLGLGQTAALAAGLWYPFLVVVMVPLGIYNMLGEPGLPFYLVALDFLLRRCPIATQLVGGVVLGAFFGFAASPFIAQPYLLMGMLFFVLVLERYRWKYMLSVGMAFALGVGMVDAPTFAATWSIKDWTQRLMVRADWQPAASAVMAYLKLHISEPIKDNILPLVVLFFGVSAGMLKRRLARWFVVVALVCGVFAFFIPGWLVSLTGWRIFKAFRVDRLYILLPFFLTTSALIGLEQALVALKLGKEQKGVSKVAAGVIALVSLGVAAMFYLGVRRYQVYAGAELGSQKTLAIATFGLTVVLLLLSGLATRAARGSWRTAAGWYMAAAIPFAALFTLSDRLVSNLLSAENFRELFHRQEYAQVRSEWQSQAPFRVATLYPDNPRGYKIWAEPPLHPAFALVSGLETADGYMPLYPGRYHLFWRKVIEPVRLKQPIIRNNFDDWGQRVYLFAEDYFSHKLGLVTGDEFNLNLLSLANVQYLFAKRDINREGLEKVRDGADGGVSVYKNEMVLPRFFIVHRATVFEDSTALLDSLAKTGVEMLRDMAFLEAAHMPEMPDSSGGESDTVVVRGYKSDRIELEIQSADEGVLIAANNWFPGWKATVNGAVTPVVPADFTFQGIAVPAGRSQVVLYYDR